MGMMNEHKGDSATVLSERTSQKEGYRRSNSLSSTARRLCKRHADASARSAA